MSDQEAFTVPPGRYRSYPEYLNVTRDGSTVRVTVRGPEVYNAEKGWYECGQSIAMTMTLDEWEEFVERAARVK